MLLRLLALVYERHQVVEIGPGGLRGGGESFRWGVRSIYPERAIAVDAGADRVPTTVRAERDLCARHSECGRTHLLGAWIGFERSDTISAQVSVENATQTLVLHPGVEHDRGGVRQERQSQPAPFEFTQCWRDLWPRLQFEPRGHQSLPAGGVSSNPAF